MMTNEHGLQDRYSLATKSTKTSSASVAALARGDAETLDAMAAVTSAIVIPTIITTTTTTSHTTTATHLATTAAVGAIDDGLLPRRRPHDEGTFLTSTRQWRMSSAMASRSGIPSLWSCGVVVGVIFCLMNKQVMTLPLLDSDVEKSDTRSKRSISDQILDQMALDWLLNKAEDHQKPLSRVSRATSDQILAEIESQWHQTNGSGARPSSARARRFASEDEEERAIRRRSLAKQRLVDFLVRQRLRQLKGGGGGGGEAANDNQEVEFSRLGRAK